MSRIAAGQRGGDGRKYNDDQFHKKDYLQYAPLHLLAIAAIQHQKCKLKCNNQAIYIVDGMERFFIKLHPIKSIVIKPFELYW